MTAAELRDKYAVVFGEPAASGNRAWLVRRVGWRMQALAEGDLSERARARAAELLLRAVDDTPPVTAVEFADLAAWARVNEARLLALADGDGLVPPGDGSGAVFDEVQARFGRGPRWPGAGEAAEVVRRLRARYGGGGA